MSALLKVRNLHTSFYTAKGKIPAVSGVDLTLEAGKTLAIVGESGSGKSVAVQSIMRLVAPPGKIEHGHIRFRNEDLLAKPEKEMRRIRGNRISMIFQEPMTSLNPVFTCSEQIVETIRLHESCSRKQARERALELFRLVGIPAPEQRLDQYPDQLSGGMRQRVMIAMALACKPEILIADEPTTALDVTIQAQILELLKSLQRQFGMAVLLITHDMGVVAEMADHVVVMYAGKIVESGPTNEIFNRPKHPYTQGLLQSIPRLETEGKASGRRLNVIEGMVPDLLRLPQGCSFAPRCIHAKAECRTEAPSMVAVGDGHETSCLLYGEKGEEPG